MPQSSNLNQARSGDDDALGRILESFRTYLQLMAEDEMDSDLQPKVGASDIVQDTLFEAHRDFGQFAGGTTTEFVAWLRQIMRNNLANVRRRYLHTLQRRVSCEVSLTANDSCGAAYQLSDPSATPQAKAVLREQDELVDTLLAALPAEYQQVLRLRHAEGLPFVEIAQRMNRSADAARKLWARAIDRLQGDLAEDSE